MKVHYSYSPFSRLTACGLLATTVDMSPHITHDPGEITCKSCLRCFNRYVNHQQEVIESTKHLSNEKLLVRVMEDLVALWDCPYSVVVELTDFMQVLFTRLIDIGFITEPNEVLVNLYYIG